jgi:hypothetical protein
MRTPKPWYRASKDVWYVEFNGQQIRLAKGRANEKAATQVTVSEFKFNLHQCLGHCVRRPWGRELPLRQ